MQSVEKQDSINPVLEHLPNSAPIQCINKSGTTCTISGPCTTPCNTCPINTSLFTSAVGSNTNYWCQ